MSDETPAAELAPAPDTLHGRSVFAVDMPPAGLSVHTAFLTDQNQIIEMPAMFPDVHYALAQIDEVHARAPNPAP